jgi:hypothetical protein
MNKPLHILDFDGVICDSRKECMITSFHAYVKFKNIKLSGDYLKNISKRQQIIFLEKRYLVRTAPEYRFLWDLIFEDKFINEAIDLSDQVDFDSIQAEKYNHLFFEERERWKKTDLQGWLHQNQIYPGIIQKLSELIDQDRLQIVSSKDSKSIHTILKFNQLKISADQIHGHEEGDKCEIMSKNFANSDNKIIFVDDHIGNLLKLKHFPISLYLATWGYNTESNLLTAQKHGIQNISLNSFLSLP